jgi:hypothetical protein
MSKEKPGRGIFVLFHHRNYQQLMLCEAVPRAGEIVSLGDDVPHGIVEAVLFKMEEDEKSMVPHVLLRVLTAGEKKMVGKFDNIR